MYLPKKFSAQYNPRLARAYAAFDVRRRTPGVAISARPSAVSCWPPAPEIPALWRHALRSGQFAIEPDNGLRTL